MGLDVNGTKFLLYARRLGVSFERTATIGRQTMLVDSRGLARNMRAFGYDITPAAVKSLLENEYAEEFLKALGAKEVTSFDGSDYEGASIVHDFNYPIPDEFKNRFSVVLDGGTLEHIFNFPTAIKNCMEMVEIGGYFLGITPANNHFGHGFYQFSPELYFRIFSLANGFHLEKMAVFEETRKCPWYEITDPEALGERVYLINHQPTMLLVVAKKISNEKINAYPPVQSDYRTLWENKAGPIAAPKDNTIKRIARAPKSMFRRISIRLERLTGMLERRPKHFKRFDPESQ
jgi:hypothetical protein